MPWRIPRSGSCATACWRLAGRAPQPGRIWPPCSGLDRFAFLRQFKEDRHDPYAWLKRRCVSNAANSCAHAPAGRQGGAGSPVFFDQSHFHHGFGAFGLTPADYRQQMLPGLTYPPQSFYQTSPASIPHAAASSL